MTKDIEARTTVAGKLELRFSIKEKDLNVCDARIVPKGVIFGQKYAIHLRKDGRFTIEKVEA